jgi:hypothetical protein
MNKRIKELATEARLLTGWPVGEVEYQKFAELIVRECAELTLDHKNDNYYTGWLDYRDEIKRHFGVDE